MSFREQFLNALRQRAVPTVTRLPIDPLKMQAFNKRDIEMAIQLYTHLKNMGNTMEDLVAFRESKMQTERRASTSSAIKSAIFLTREARKKLRGGGRKGKLRRSK